MVWNELLELAPISQHFVSIIDSLMSFAWRKCETCGSLDINKTKELIDNFRKEKSGDQVPVFLGGPVVERVSSFKLLGINSTDDHVLSPAEKCNHEEGVSVPPFSPKFEEI